MSSDETRVERATISDAMRRGMDGPSGDQASPGETSNEYRGFVSDVAQNIAPGVGNAIGATPVALAVYGATKGWDKLTGGDGKPPEPPADK
jgi:hypothetical protein